MIPVEKSVLRFLKRDEWLALIPLKVLVQRVDGSPVEGGIYPSVAEGKFEMILRGPNAGLVQVGDWSCRLEEGLAEQLTRFYESTCPEKTANIPIIVREYGYGKQAELNGLLMQLYGKDLSSVPKAERARVRRVYFLTFVVEIGFEDFAITFPGPLAKRMSFAAELEEAFSMFSDYTCEVPADALLGLVEFAAPKGLWTEYHESSVPEMRGPLKQDADGASVYGKKIHAGGHKIADGLRDGSEWLSERMLAGTEKLSAWLGPAKEEARLHPNVEKGLSIAKEGTGKLLDFTRDVLGGLGAVAAKGVTWTADRIASTDAYKEWEKKPQGPRAKAAQEIAGSTFNAILTVGSGVRDAAHNLLDHGVKPCVVHASSARWGRRAGDAADKSVSAVLNVHYTALYGGAFLADGAGAVVGHLSKMALCDAATRTILVQDLKSNVPITEGALLLNELAAFGGRTSVWSCYICALRPKSLALYEPVGRQEDGGDAVVGHAGLKVGEKGDGHMVITEIEEGGGAARSEGLHVGDVVLGVDGMSVEKLRPEDVDALLVGPVGSIVRLSVCRGGDVQAVAEEALSRSEDGEDFEVVDGQAVAQSLKASVPTLLQVAVERRRGRIAEALEEDMGFVVTSRPEQEEEESRPECIPHSDDWTYFPAAKKPTPVGGEAVLVGGDCETEDRSFMLGKTLWGLAKLERIIALDDILKVEEGFCGSVQSSSEEETRPHIFSIQSGSHHKPLVFQAPTEKAMQNWVAKISAALTEYKRNIKETKVFS